MEAITFAKAKPVSEKAWLIEMQFEGKACWWYGSGYIADANQGVRFSREDDAEQVILEHGMVGAEATEHMWINDMPERSSSFDTQLESYRSLIVGLENEIARLKEWQPIETAPKDGREILAGAVGITFAWVISWLVCDGKWLLSNARDGMGKYYFEPTHWMPLPERPGKAGG